MEGPSLVILKEELSRFKKKKVLKVSGNSKQPIKLLEGKSLQRIETWGKTIFLIFSGNIVTRTHFMLFGTYRIDDPKTDRIPRLELKFPDGILSFYACAFSMDAKRIWQERDHRIDVLSKKWNESFVLKQMKGKEAQK